MLSLPAPAIILKKSSPPDRSPPAPMPRRADADRSERKASTCACSRSATDCSDDARASKSLARYEMVTVVADALDPDDDAVPSVLPVSAFAVAVPDCEIDQLVYDE